MGYLSQASNFIRHARIVYYTREYSSVISHYLLSRRPATEIHDAISSVHSYVMFIGIGRSGTTLIGSLLDAHPRMIIANEQNTLKYVRLGLIPRAQIYWLLIKNSRDSAHAGRIGGGGYKYAVPGQSQGEFDTLEVIGDKSRSGRTVAWLNSTPVLLDRLATVTQARIRIIQVIRNPFDTIATRSIRRKLPLEQIYREYFALCEKLQRLISRIDEISDLDVERIPVSLEDFIEQPDMHLEAICEKLGVSADNDYLQACAGIVYKQPNKSRFKVSWDKKLVEEIEERLENIPFLQRYSFDD